MNRCVLGRIYIYMFRKFRMYVLQTQINMWVQRCRQRFDPKWCFPGSDHMSCTRAIALHDFDPTEYKELLQATLLLAAKHFEAKISAGLVASITTATADLQLRSMMARWRRCCTMAHQLQTQRWKPSMDLTSVSHRARCVEAQSTWESILTMHPWLKATRDLMHVQ